MRSAVNIFVASVSTMPGAMQFAVKNPRRPYSAAIDFVADTNAPLEAAYADIDASPVVPAIDVMLIIRPYLLRPIIGSDNLHRLYGTVKFTCIMCCMYVGSVFTTIFPSTIPALLINMSMRSPNFWVIVSISVCSACVAVKSNGIVNGFGAALGLDAISFSDSVFSLSWLRPVKTTCAPWV